MSANMPLDFTQSYGKAGVLELFHGRATYLRFCRPMLIRRTCFIEAPTGGGRRLWRSY